MDYYFSYGSNNWQQVKDRTGNQNITKPLPVKLFGYKRVFQGYSKNWHNSGKANILPSVDAVVYGSLYHLNSADLKRLFTYEHGYSLVQVTVHDIHTNDQIKAYTFLFKGDENYTEPSKEYLAAIRQNLLDVGLESELDKV